MYNRPTLSAPTALGLPEPLERALPYVLGWITGIIFLVIERNPTVRRHAWQSIVIFGSLSIAIAVLGLLSHVWVIGLIFLVVGWIAKIVWIPLAILLFVLALLSPNTFINNRRIA